MAYTHVEPTRTYKGWEGYVSRDKWDKEKERGVLWRSTVGDPVAFENALNSVWSTHGSRREKMGYSLTVSYAVDDVDLNDPSTWEKAEDHLEYMMDVQFPNAMWAAKAHVEAGKFHWHVFVANHDLETKKALPLVRHFQVARASDEASRMLDMDVIQPDKGKVMHSMENKALKVGEPIDDVLYGDTDARERLTKYNWREYVRSALEDAATDPRAHGSLDGMAAAIQDRGISVQVKATAKNPEPSLTYALLDDDGEVLRLGRTKCAVTGKKLGESYMFGGMLEQAARAHEQRQRAEQARARKMAQDQQVRLRQRDEDADEFGFDAMMKQLSSHWPKPKSEVPAPAVEPAEVAAHDQETEAEVPAKQPTVPKAAPPVAPPKPAVDLPIQDHVEVAGGDEDEVAGPLATEGVVTNDAATALVNDRNSVYNRVRRAKRTAADAELDRQRVLKQLGRQYGD